MLSKHHTIRRGPMLGVSRPEDSLAPLKKRLPNLKREEEAEPKSAAILRDARRKKGTQPHPEEAAQRPSRRMSGGLLRMRDDCPETESPRPRIRYNPRHHAGVFAAIADVTGVWIHCEHRACLRAKRCCAKEPPCFVTHIADFHEYLHRHLGPRFRKEIAKQEFIGADAG